MITIDKIPIFEWFYQQGDVYVTIVIKNNDNVRVPSQFNGKEMETFIVGSTPTPDLTYDKEGMSTSMRFGPGRFTCFFPWNSIIMMTGESAVIQFKIKEKSVSDTTNEEVTQKKEKPSKKKSFLKVVK